MSSSVIVSAFPCPSCGELVEGTSEHCEQCGTCFIGGNDSTVVRQDALIGTQLGDYRVERWLGMGGMGIVYEGLQADIGKRVAIKVMRPDFTSTAKEVQRLVEEARTVNAIGHRGVVDIFGSGVLPDGRQYLVMEYLNGSSLDLVITRKAPLHLVEATFILDEILEVLSEVHAAGVVHRDLKPSNVFLVSAGRASGSSYVKILDFGVSKRLPPGTTTGETPASSIIGTPEYISPEQARGKVATRASDVYAVGVIAFELFTGKRPYSAASAVELMVCHVQSPVPTPSSVESSVPPRIDHFVHCLMAKSPSERPTAAEARAMLQEITAPKTVSIETSLPHLPPVAENLQKAPAPSRVPRTSKAVVIAGLALVALLIGAVRLLRATPDTQVASTSPSPPTTSPAVKNSEELVPLPAVTETPKVPVQPAIAEAELPRPNKTSSKKKAAPVPLASLQLLPARVTGEVFINNKSYGHLPRPALSLPSGKYEVRVQNSVLGTFKKTLVLRPGVSTELPITREDFAP